MLRTLYGRLALALAALVTASLAFQVAVTMGATEAHMEEATQRLHFDLAASVLRVELWSGDSEKPAVPVLEGDFETLMHVNPQAEFYLLDPEGGILAHKSPVPLARTRVDVAPIHALLGPAPVLPIRGDDPRDAVRRKVFSAAPVNVDGEMCGYLYVILAGEQYASTLELLRGSQIAQVSIRALAVVSLFALAAALLLFRSITRPLTRLSSEMAGFLTEDAGPRAPAPRNEIAALESAFGALSARVRSQVSSLEELDRLRRELVAGVSHDLRTPLALLQGYLETLQVMDAELDPAERQRYLEAASRHSHRLSTLVDELFELAKLEGGAVQPVLEPMNLVELAQDVLLKFELAAREKGIALGGDFHGGHPLARGDVVLVERLLDNLLTNAIRHTPEGGAVRVDVARDGDTLALEVADTGPGIAAEALPRIFERFYRGSEEPAGGIGLGLAIAQRIAALHGSEITVESAPGEGARFRFRLGLA